MKVFGQGIKDAAERFFHGMYVSAAGDHSYGNDTQVDGNILDPTTIIEATQNAFMTNPASFLMASILIALVAIFAIVGMFHLYERRNESAMITQGIQT